MSVAQSSKCLFCTFSRTVRQAAVPRQNFHTSPAKFNRKPKFPSVKAEVIPGFVDLGKANEKPVPGEELKEHFSSEQQASIRAAEKIITEEQLERESLRTDPWSLSYYDDLASRNTVVDKPERKPWTNIDESSRLKSEDELMDDLRGFMENLPNNQEQAQQAWQNFDRGMRITTGREEAEIEPRSASAPDLPKLVSGDKKPSKAKKNADGRVEEEVSPAMIRLMQMTGLNDREIARLRVKSIVSHGVVNQTRLGKIRKQYYLSIAGNGNGLIGIGEGKSEEPQEGMLQSQYRAIRNMQPVRRYENRTIFGDVAGKSGATELELYARPPGFGLRCQSYIWEICKCAGIHDLAARVTRARNPMNVVKATVEALVSQKDPEEIARARGRKLVDVRKVYYAGNV